MIKFYINSYFVFVPKNSTVLEACQFLGFEIPRFCFDERLSIAGNCRMCLIEIEKVLKPTISCTLPVLKNLRIFTNSPLVKKTRESILEFLLLNHPLDCPICDQASECDLQDHSFFFGSDKTRFFENKRAIENKNCGVLIKTVMNRCVHCSRCVRFFSKFVGNSFLGITNRSHFSEIGTFVSKILTSELSGNIIDLCPVGALTSKNYKFISRIWELKTLETIDIHDGFCSPIFVDFKENTPVRILSKNNFWITDKCRFNFDSFFKYRICTTSIKKKTIFLSSSWQQTFKLLNFLIRFCELHFLYSIYSDLSCLFEIKFFAEQQGFKNVGFPRKVNLNFDFSENFLCNISLANLEKADFCLLVNINTKLEASAINLKLLRRFRNGFFNAIFLGIYHKNSFKKVALSISLRFLFLFSDGKHTLCKKFRLSHTPTILIGITVAQRKDFFGLKKIIQDFSKPSTNKNNLSLLNQEPNQVGAFFLGLSSFDFSFNYDYRLFQCHAELSKKKELTKQKVCFFLGSFKNIEIDTIEKKIPFKTHRILLSSHGCSFTLKSDIIIPTKVFLEKEGFFVNLEGKFQKTQINSLQFSLSKTENSLLEIFRKNSYIKSKGFFTWKNISIQETNFGLEKESFSKGFYNKGKIFFSYFFKEKSTFKISGMPCCAFVIDFFNTDPFSKFSTKMQKCSNTNRLFFNNFFL